MSNWYSILIRKDNVEDVLPVLVESDVAGSELLGEDTARLYLQCDNLPEEFCARLENDFDCAVEETSEIRNEDWISMAQSDWRELKIGCFHIIPVLSDNKNDGEEEKEACQRIFLAPGLGFGTGEHSTTKNVLKYLQDNRLEGKVSRTLDVGTGSGILAIASALHHKSDVIAIDIDADALENARCNLKNNNVSEKVHLCLATIDGVSGGFDIVVANVYAEVLIDIRDELFKRVQSGGSLIISGIMDTKADSVKEAFAHPDFFMVDEITDEKWTTIWYQRSQS